MTSIAEKKAKILALFLGNLWLDYIKTHHDGFYCSTFATFLPLNFSMREHRSYRHTHTAAAHPREHIEKHSSTTLVRLRLSAFCNSNSHSWDVDSVSYDSLTMWNLFNSTAHSTWSSMNLNYGSVVRDCLDAFFGAFDGIHQLIYTSFLYRLYIS